MAALVCAASLDCATAAAEVIDAIAIERHDSAARIRLHLTSPMHYLRQFTSEEGGTVNVYLQALAPLPAGEGTIPDEVKYSPENALVPRFSVRVSLDPRCEPVPHPVCIVVRFARAVRHEVRLGEDRRSLLLDVPIASARDGRSAKAGERP